MTLAAAIVLSRLQFGENIGAAAAALIAALAFLPPAFAADGHLPLAKIADVPLSGTTARFDYQTIDPSAGRLFISHMGEGTIIVFDLAARHEIATLPGFPGATGITAVPSLGRVFVSATGHWWNSLTDGGRIAAIDTKTFKTAWTVYAGRFPDGIAYVPSVHRLFVSDESGGREIVIDAEKGKSVAEIPLDGKAGMTAFDTVDGHIYVNVQDRGTLDAIDPETLKIAARHRLPAECKHNHGLSIDAASHRAFIACDGNARLLVFDLAAQKVLSSFSVGDDPDVLAFDAARGRLYVASESGTLSVFGTGPQGIVKLGEGFTGRNAHSVAVDPATGMIYLPLRNLDGHPVLRIMAFHRAQP